MIPSVLSLLLWYHVDNMFHCYLVYIFHFGLLITKNENLYNKESLATLLRPSGNAKHLTSSPRGAHPAERFNFPHTDKKTENGSMYWSAVEISDFGNSAHARFARERKQDALRERMQITAVCMYVCMYV